MKQKKRKNKTQRCNKTAFQLTLEALRGGGGGGGGGGSNWPPALDFFGLKFLLLDRLSKALAQLFLVCEHIF